MRSIYDNAQVDGLAAAFNTNGVVVTGSVVDTKGYNTAALRVFVTPTAGSLSASQLSSLTAVLTECATSNGTFTAALDNTGTQIGLTVVATTTAVIGAARIEGLGINRLRYFKVQTTGRGVSLAASNFTSAAVIELGRGFQRPPTTTVSNT